MELFMDNKSYNNPSRVTTTDPPPPAEQQPVPAPRQLVWNWTDIALIVGVSIMSLAVGLSISSSILPINNSNNPAASLATVNFTIAGLIVEFLVFTGTIYFLGLQRKHLNWEALGLSPLIRLWIAGAVGIGLVEFAIENAATYGASVMLRVPDSALQGGIATQGLSWVNLIILFALAGAAIPFAEELLFRGVLYNFVRERWGIWIGALVSALLYALFSFDLINGVACFVLSIFAIIAYERSKSLWGAITVHMMSSIGSLVLFFILNPSLLKMPIF
jgi:membrane protease YdiL (CAAX protease family)